MSAEYFSPAKIEEATIKVNEGGNKTANCCLYTMKTHGTKKGTIQNLFKLAKSLLTVIKSNTKSGC